MAEKFRIFIVHGTNHRILEEVDSYLKNDLGLDPIILLNEPAAGRTLIEKFEYYADSVKYAIVILSDDDFGLPRQDSEIGFIKKMSDHFKWLSMYLPLSANTIHIYPENRQQLKDYLQFSDLLSNIRYRGRQNVILEMGYFMGKLGRMNLAILYTPEVELPSDMQGFNYIPYDDGGNWKQKIAKEILHNTTH
jgi:predicted nucleotide-binding protein